MSRYTFFKSGNIVYLNDTTSDVKLREVFYTI